ncbi:MAG: hypothetical protein AAB320_03735 [Elusimicrobiota bacterium]
MNKITLAGALAVVVIFSAGSGSAWARPKGAQFLETENLQDEATLNKFVSEMVDDGKAKNFGKIKKVIIPTYYLEFRTVSSGKALTKGLKDVSVNATVTYANPDKAVMEEIAAAGLADLKTKLAAAGYEVVDAGDIKALEQYKNLSLMPSGTIGESTAQPIGWSKFKAMFATAGGEPTYTVIPGETNWSMKSAYTSYALDGALWKAAGGEDVGIVRSRMLIDFVTFVAESGKSKTGDYESMANDGWSNYAKISAIPRIQIWLPSLCVTRTYVFFRGTTGGDNMGCVNVKPEIQLSSKMGPADLGTLVDTNGAWNFTANNAKYKEAVIEQVKITNTLLVGKAKTFIK